MLRRPVLTLVAVVLLLALSTATGSAQPPPPRPDHLRAFSIVPPGQNGQGVGLSPGVHGDDQREMYAALIDDDDVTEDELSNYFHSAQFGPGATIEREYSPIEGATVYRDELGIPHVYAEDDLAAFEALGYVTAEDRLWHMTVLKFAGRGRLSEILGSAQLGFDTETRTTGYSERELEKMIEGLERKFGADGALIADGLQAYADGVNARMAEIEADEAPLPGEFVLNPQAFEPWAPIDSAAIVILQLRQFGTAPGGDLANAAVLQSLEDTLGRSAGKVFDDIIRLNDPSAHATVPESEGRYESQNLGRPNPRAVALPDRAGSIIDRLTRRANARAGMLKRLAMFGRASNFLAVAPSESVTGHALEFGAPQVGYSVPQFFIDIDVHSPSFDFRGPAVPGASLLVPLGRGIDYAWSLTTGASDVDDTRVEKLCNPSGRGRVTKRSNGYLFKGDCRRMSKRIETIEVKNGNSHKITVRRTMHGPVLARATASGDPVAIVNQAAYWKREVDNVKVFYDINRNEMDSVEEFQAAVSQATVSFNAVYVDEEDIGYFHLGRYPKRARGVDQMLPSWGTGRWEWRGTLPFDSQPQMINPTQGWIANWNNKPAVGWDNSQSSAWGPTHRVGLLDGRMEALLAGDNKASLSDVVDVIREAATADARAAFLGEALLDFTADVTGAAAQARQHVADWMAGGAHRLDRNRDELQDFGPAVAVFDRWYDELAHRVFDDELGASYPYLNLAIPISDDASVNNGSAYYSDFSNFLWNLYRDDTKAAYSRDYCENIGTEEIETCESVAVDALEATVEDLATEMPGPIETWTWPADYIEFSEVGAYGVDPIPWQNRGTYNHAIEVLGGR